MVDHVDTREKIIKSLCNELFGPLPEGKELDTSIVNKFKGDEWYGPWKQKGTGEEILIRDTPTKRYGIGVLYKYGVETELYVSETGSDSIGLIGKIHDEAGHQEDDNKDERDDNIFTNVDKIADKISKLTGVEGQNDLDLSLANSYRPCSMGVSFLAEITEQTEITVDVTGGRYENFTVEINGSPAKWWVRIPVTFTGKYLGKSLLINQQSVIKPDIVENQNTGPLDLHIELYARPYQDNKQLITVVLVNRTASGSIDESSLFQTHIEVKVLSSDGKKSILPYPGLSIEQLKDDEDLSLALLYRKRPTYAIGHGCSANWETVGENDRPSWISAECIPIYETPSMTPDIQDKNNQPIKVSMRVLAGLVPDNDGFEVLEKIVELYEDWIVEREAEIRMLQPELQNIATKHMEAARRCANRMRDGVNYLKNNPQAFRAFQLANEAILLQQLHARKELRKATYDDKAKRISFSEDFQEINPLLQDTNKGDWRAFQIAFLLMSLRSAVDGFAPDRETVELIWFPTGGGKTEAYLGLAAFALFMRRMNDNEDDGVHVLMRYTLRLLTTQQFQRSARLICAMEYIRKKNRELLGNLPFSIGLWVGGNNTPNTRNEALTILRKLNKGDRSTDNKFVLDRCPWCGAQMGPLNHSGRTSKKLPVQVIGYIQEGPTVVFKCPDNKCPFSSGLPVYVIDEDIYEFKPSLIIGTVDKFAMLAWNALPRALFGIGKDGKRIASPPGLIIQDELHLIAGPLGSMVGLYESVIEELCTDRRGSIPVKPKIVCSTATIRRYKEQIKALYAREDAVLFPPPGLDEGDSFFGRYATQKDGKLAPGRKYIGIHAPGLGSMQTVQVRTFTALLQASMQLSEDERDPWWTLLIFFNSLRELGTTLSLFQSDIPDYQKVYINRLTNRAWRRFWEIRELTGRTSGEDIPKAIAALEESYPNSNTRPVDVCLASNILEVGIDIERLSLMVIVGQPKTTSQYIQVSGRVGRNWREKPGLVVTLYSASKPRDRSHFEKFRSYHEKLYSQVEPTSVTPFSPPALDRALHAVMAAYVQQVGDEDNIYSPYPYPMDLIDQLRDILMPRVKSIDPDEVENFISVFEKRSNEWKRWQHTLWKANRKTEDFGLLRVAGAYATKEEAMLSWSTQQSMRSVDAECITEIPVSLISSEGEDYNA